MTAARTERLQSVVSRSVSNGGQRGPAAHPRIALLTPYAGGNLGDAAIQDAAIANIRLRLPDVQFSGICLNCDNFVDRHGSDAFPLCGNNGRFYGMYLGRIGERLTARSSHRGLNVTLVKSALKRVPVLGWCLTTIRASWRELRHWVEAYRFLRRHNLVIVSGGGQLNEEWGGPWCQPFALCKWAILARIARIPYVVASVGAGKAASKRSRLFLSVALRMAAYRSYRDQHSRAFAECLAQVASTDPVVPDLAFSLPASELPTCAGARATTMGRPTVAISPIAYAKPQCWPSEDRAHYERYVEEMGRVVTELLERDYVLVMVYSSLGDDQSVIADILERLDDRSKDKLGRQMYIPVIKTWRDLVASLLEVDLLIASRLHCAILGSMAQRPTVAISFDPKVDWVMEDLGQTEYLLEIRTFTARDVIEALERLEMNRRSVVELMGSYRRRNLPAAALQYDTLARLATAAVRRRE